MAMKMQGEVAAVVVQTCPPAHHFCDEVGDCSDAGDAGVNIPLC